MHFHFLSIDVLLDSFFIIIHNNKNEFLPFLIILHKFRPLKAPSVAVQFVCELALWQSLAQAGSLFEFGALYFSKVVFRPFLATTSSVSLAN